MAQFETRRHTTGTIFPHIPCRRNYMSLAPPPLCYRRDQKSAFSLVLTVGMKNSPSASSPLFFLHFQQQISPFSPGRMLHFCTVLLLLLLRCARDIFPPFPPVYFLLAAFSSFFPSNGGGGGRGKRGRIRPWRGRGGGGLQLYVV